VNRRKSIKCPTSLRIDKMKPMQAQKLQQNSKEQSTKRKHWKYIKLQRTIKLICCDWLQETIKYEPGTSELAKLK
jgi:hypothetical protein